tara:strand:- start:142 stop:876 length:735 start_codon:yes stop_codon:yes gene_type:complete
MINLKQILRIKLLFLGIIYLLFLDVKSDVFEDWQNKNKGITNDKEKRELEYNSCNESIANFLGNNAWLDHGTYCIFKGNPTKVLRYEGPNHIPGVIPRKFKVSLWGLLEKKKYTAYDRNKKLSEYEPFSTYDIDEFKKKYSNKDKYEHSLTVYKVLPIPEGFRVFSFSCSAYSISQEKCLDEIKADFRLIDHYQNKELSREQDLCLKNLLRNPVDGTISRTASCLDWIDDLEEKYPWYIESLDL